MLAAEASASQAETQAPSDDELRIAPGSLLAALPGSTSLAASIEAAGRRAPTPAPASEFVPTTTTTKKKLDFMGGPRGPPPPAAAAPVMYECVACERRLPHHMGACQTDGTGLWTCNKCLEMTHNYERQKGMRKASVEEEDDIEEEAPSIALDAPTPTLVQMQRQLQAPLRRSSSRTWIDEGDELAKEMRTAADSQAAVAASADRKGKLKRLAEVVKTKKNSAPAAAAAVASDEDDIEDGVPRRKLGSLGAPLPILPTSMRLEEMNSIENKPWRDRIPPCQTCIEKRVRVANTAVCLGSCGHFIGCIECCAGGDAFIDELRCPARDCYATVEFIVVVRNAIN